MERILKFIIDDVNKECRQLIEEKDDWIYEVKVNYFDDSEAIDLGVWIVVCDKNNSNFREKYFSFIVHNKKLKLMILEYLDVFGKYERYPY